MLKMGRLRLLEIFGFFLILWSPEVIQAEGENAGTPSEMTEFRLPNDTQPLYYKIKLIPLLNATFENETSDEIPESTMFEGEVTIKFEVTQSTGTNRIVLNVMDLDVKTVHVVQDEDEMVVEVIKITLSKENQQLIIETDKLLYRYEYNVTIKYQGTHSNDMKGFYQSVYMVDSKMKVLAITQFEPTHARRAFPCYDEPKYRTPFEVMIARREDQVSLSNMPLLNSVIDSGLNRTWDVFQTTEKMATYLVAFAVGTLEGIGALQQDSWSLKVWARENAVDQAKYISEEAPKLLRQLEELTGMSYNLPKMDIVSVPDFSAGAMENWGLTTFRESRVLTSNLSTTRQKRLVTEVVAHEFAHQWFGDLVTPVWWSYVWLNEAFATYYEYLTTYLVEPTWDMRELFVVEELQTALNVDGCNVHRPMTSYVNTPAEIDELFDEIIYNKGGSILRMLQYMVSKETFNKAINRYLKAGIRVDGSVTPDFLWNAFETQAKIDKQLPADIKITDVMKTWTEQPGHPLVTVTRQYNENTVNITQEVYKNTRSTKTLDKYTWQIPISCTSKQEQNFDKGRPKIWLTNESMVVDMTLKEDEWLICNLKETGYYRVNYDQKNWDLIIDQLMTNHSAINVLNRAQLIDDSFHLAMDEVISFQIPFKIVEYLQKENEIVPWISAINVFYYLRDTYQNTKIQHLLETLFTRLMTEPYKRYTLEEKSEDDFRVKFGRQTLTTAACSFNVEDCVTEARGLMSEWVDSNYSKPLSPDVLQAAFCVGVRYEDIPDFSKTVWNFFLNNSDNAGVAEIVYPSLACSQNETHLESFLGIPFSKTLPYRKQDQRYILQAIQKYRGANAAFTIIKKNLEKIESVDKSTLDVLKNMLSSLGKYGATENHLSEMNNIVESEEFKKAPKEFQESATKAQERIKIRVDWRAKHTDTMIDILNRDAPTTPEPTEKTTEHTKPTEQPTTEHTTEKASTISPEPTPSTTPKPSSAYTTYAAPLLTFACLLYSFCIRFLH